MRENGIAMNGMGVSHVPIRSRWLWALSKLSKFCEPQFLRLKMGRRPLLGLNKKTYESCFCRITLAVY